MHQALSLLVNYAEVINQHGLLAYREGGMSDASPEGPERRDKIVPLDTLT